MGKFIAWLKKFGFNEKQAKRIAAKYPKATMKQPGVAGVIMKKKDKDQFMLLNSALSYDPNISKYSVRRVGVDGRYYHLLREYELLDKEIARTAKAIYEGNLIVGAEELKHWKTNLDKWRRTQKDLNEMTNKLKAQNIDPKDAFYNYEKKLKERRTHPSVDDPHQPQTMEELGYEMEFIKREADDMLKNVEELNKKIGILDEAGEYNIGKFIAKEQKEVIDLQRDGMRRALARPFLLEMDKRGIINLRNDIRNSLEKSTDLQSGGFNKLAYPDPTDVFTYHFGDEAWKAIDEMMMDVTNADIYGSANKKKLADKIIEKVKVQKTDSPNHPGLYLSQEKIKSKIEDIDESMNYIAYGDDGWVKELGEAERADKLKPYAQESEEWQKLLAPENFPPGVKPPMLSKPKLKKSDLKVVGGKDSKLLPGSKSYMEMAIKKDRPNIRLMKNFDQELTDIGLAQEGYNLQEIDIIRRAREVMKRGDANHPDDALNWVRGEMADEAGEDITEFMIDFDWGDGGGNAHGGLPRRRYAFGSSGELTALLDRLKMVQEGTGIYADYSSANRKAMQISLTSRINALLGK